MFARFLGIPSGLIGLYLNKFLAPTIRVIWKNADALVANSAMLKQKALKLENRYPIDTISNVVLEAMAMGLTILMTPCGGLDMGCAAC